MENINNMINSLPPAVIEVALDVILSTLAVSTAGVAFKKWWRVNSEKVMIGFVILTSFAAPTVLYLKDVPQFAAWIVLVEGLMIIGSSQPLYFLVFKPLRRRIGAWWAKELTRASKVRAMQDDIKSALEPAGGLQMSPATVPSPAVAATRVEIQEFTH